jgi:hypothetical protein
MLVATSQKPSTRDTTMMTWSVRAPMPLGDYVVAGREGCADVVIHAPSFRDYADLACGFNWVSSSSARERDPATTPTPAYIGSWRLESVRACLWRRCRTSDRRLPAMPPSS